MLCSDNACVDVSYIGFLRRARIACVKSVVVVIDGDIFSYVSSYCPQLCMYLIFNTLRTGSFKLFKRPLPGFFNNFNPLNAELNPICYLLALLGVHHFLHVSRIRVKSLTLRLLMSYICMERLLLMFLDHTQRRSTVGRTPLDE